jgi:cysteine desulfurase
MSPAVYLDYNATSSLKPKIKAAVERYLAEGGNPSSVHAAGRRARAAVDRAREQVAALLGVKPASVVFTSGGTEANNQALRCAGAASMVISAVEHDSVIGAAYAAGVPVFEVPVDGEGVVRLDALRDILAKAPKPALLSVMRANNETGVLQPVREAFEIAREQGAITHCDAIQAAGKMSLSFEDIGADLLSLSAHKISGLPGAGALVFRPGFNLSPLLYGGGQEQGYRSGTENVAGIVAFGQAAEEAKEDFGKNSKIKELRDILETRLKAISNRVRVFGEGVERLPNTSCLTMPGVPSETQVMAFDLKGICVSSGSACSSGKVKTSHVMKAMGVAKEDADCMIRVSLGWGSTKADVEALLEAWQGLYRHAGSQARAGE